MDIGETLGRKLGPLPAWGWGVAIGGALLAVRMLRPGGGRMDTVVVPTGAPQPSAEYLSDVGEALQDVRERLDWLYQQSNNNMDERPKDDGRDNGVPPPNTGAYPGGATYPRKGTAYPTPTTQPVSQQQTTRTIWPSWLGLPQRISSYPNAPVAPSALPSQPTTWPGYPSS